MTGADLYPTIAEFAGDDARPGETDGRSLVPLLEGRGELPPRDLFWYYPHYSPQAKQPGAAIRAGKYKLIEHYDPPRTELYDLENDLGESKNLTAEKPKMTADLKARLQACLEQSVPIRHRVNPNYDAELAAGETPE